MGSKYVNKIEYSTYVLDADMRIVRCDDFFTDITGYTRDDIENNEIAQRDLIMEEDREVYFDLVSRELAKTGEVYIEHRIKRKDGTSVLVFCLGHNTKDEKTGEPIAIVRITDMTKMSNVRIQEAAIRKETSAKVKSLITRVETDEMTGLLRRGAFIKEVGKRIAACDSFSILMADIDNFKGINDVYGHSVGDDVLIQVAEVFRNALRDSDVICRMGGDEFAILLDGVYQKERIDEIMVRIIERVKNIPVAREKGFPVKISTGIRICEASHEGVSFESLYIEADEALYRAKNNCKGSYVICGK